MAQLQLGFSRVFTLRTRLGNYHDQFRFQSRRLRPILVEIECCVSRQTRTGNLVGGVTSLGAVVLDETLCSISASYPIVRTL